MDWHRRNQSMLEQDLKQLRFSKQETKIHLIEAYSYKHQQVCGHGYVLSLAKSQSKGSQQTTFPEKRTFKPRLEQLA